MGSASARLLTPRAALVLGRVSNLPTVLSNALAGIAVAAAGTVDDGSLLPAVLSLSLLYVGGMYLNDAFDAGIDAVERPQRPIPAGTAARGLVFVLGFGMLAAGVAVGAGVAPVAGGAAMALAAAIVVYDVIHKHTVLAPLVMGACRLLAYATAAAVATRAVTAPLLWLAAVGLGCHVVGLTYAARREAYNSLDSVWPLAVLAAPLLGLTVAAVLTASSFAAGAVVSLAAALGLALFRLVRRAPGDVPRAVGLLIAAIALYDAGIVAVVGAPWPWAVLAMLCFPLTLAAQRLVPGT